MSQTILFIVPPATGHLNATFGLARLLSEKGYRIVYALPSNVHAQVVSKGFECAVLEGIPFATNGEYFLDEAAAQNRMKYLDSLLDRFYDTIYAARTQAIQEVLRMVRPDIILLDSFSPTDFVVLYPHMKAMGIKFAFLQAMLSYRPQPHSLPLDCFVVPTAHTPYGWYWKRYFFKRWLRNLGDTLRWFGRSNLNMIRRKFRQLQIDPRYSLTTRQLFRVGFEGIPEFITSPQELEFTMDKAPHQHYLGSLIDQGRRHTERIAADYRSGLRSGCPIIYTSLGTLYEQAEQQKAIYRHFRTLIEVARTLPDYEFVVSLKQEFAQKYTAIPSNVHFFDRVSQLSILAECKLFITHGGLQSLKESIASHVPMLVYPVWWDQFGYASRVEYYGLGLTGKLGKDSAKAMKRKIESLLQDPRFSERLSAFDATISANYTDDMVVESFEKHISDAKIR